MYPRLVSSPSQASSQGACLLPTLYQVPIDLSLRPNLSCRFIYITRQRGPVPPANGQMRFDVTPLVNLISAIPNALCVLRSESFFAGHGQGMVMSSHSYAEQARAPPCILSAKIMIRWTFSVICEPRRGETVVVSLVGQVVNLEYTRISKKSA